MLGRGVTACVGALWLATAALSDDGNRAAGQGSGAERKAGRPDVEPRSCWLMLDRGPVHVRVIVTLGGNSLEAARNGYVDRLIASLDADGDSALSRDEADRSPLLTSYRGSPNAAAFAAASRAPAVSRSQIMQSVRRVGGEAVVYRQDESAGLGDQQVFRFLDVDGSGVVEQTEMAVAGRRIGELDEDGDECVTLREFLPAPEEEDLQAGARAEDRPQRTSSFSTLLRDAREPLLPRRFIEKYDRDGDEQLSALELDWPADRLAALDVSGNARLDPRELTGLPATPPDVEIAVELEEQATEPRLRVLSSAGMRDDRAERANLARLIVRGAVLTFSVRAVDPVEAAVENAMQNFNRLDVDANGYLEEPETSGRIRFERGLFAALDADGDGKIFADEMQRYVTLRCEPVATSCRVNLYDMGHGFFATLDRNSDGRISVREMRGAEQTLRSLERDDSEGLSPGEPIRHFHVEFARGSYQLFGRPERMLARLPTFAARTSVGPVWFQRMDRNNDGDLTWNEFLGPRAVFHRLDGDGDGLLDPREAERAEAN